ncbi:MAG TPA: hypothetical protein VF002_07360, partial [Gaiellaceae bacterium]
QAGETRPESFLREDPCRERRLVKRPVTRSKRRRKMGEKNAEFRFDPEDEKRENDEDVEGHLKREPGLPQPGLPHSDDDDVEGHAALRQPGIGPEPSIGP